MQTEVAEIIEVENRRCRAELDRDIAALDQLLHDDLVYVHGTGSINDKQMLLTGRKDLTWVHLARRDLNIRIFGDVALVTGILSYKATKSGSDIIFEGDSFLSQVLQRVGDHWRFSLIQTTRIIN